MIAILERHKKAFLLSGIGICVLAIILTISPESGSNVVASGLSYIVVPVQRGLNATAMWVSGHFSALTNNQRLISVNRGLEAEINELQLELFRLRLAAEENELLNAALNMQQRYAHLPTMGARVIGHDPSGWQSSFRIDRGANDGIELNMAVIANGGLAGVVRYVQPNSAVFVSVVDSRFSAAVISTRTDDFGLVRGDTALMTQGLLRMDNIEPTAQIMPGDEIMTGSDSVIFPAGLLVGEVVSVHANPDGLLRHAIIRPAANLDDLEMILVITETPGAVHSD